MKRAAVSIAVAVAGMVPAIAVASPREVALTSVTVAGRTQVAAGNRESLQILPTTRPERRNVPMRAVSITARPPAARFGRETVPPADDDLRPARRRESKVVVRDIRPSTRVQYGNDFGVVALGRAVPHDDDAHAIDSRTIARADGSSRRFVLAENDGPSAASTSELMELLQEVRSPSGRSGVVAVDVRTQAEAPAPRNRMPRTEPRAQSVVTIVGRPGERVREVSGTSSQELDDAAPVLNRLNTEALAQLEAAREVRDARNEEFRTRREEALQADTEAEPDAAAPETPQPPGPREVETVRRYDWRKGIYVRVPVDDPPVPRPSIVTGPAGLVDDRQPNNQGATVLQGRVPRLTPSESDAASSTGEAAP